MVPCKFNNPKLDTCITETINTLLPSLRNKIANIDLPSLEPIVYKSIGFTYRDIGSFSVRDFKGYGISRAKVLNVKTEFNDDQILYKSEFFVPKILLTGNYKANVQFNNFKLAPKGQFNITLKSVSGRLRVNAETNKVNGDDFLNLLNFDIVPVVKEIKFSISGLFTDPSLSEFND